MSLQKTFVKSFNFSEPGLMIYKTCSTHESKIGYKNMNEQKSIIVIVFQDMSPPHRSSVLEFFSLEPGFMTLSKTLTYEWRAGCHKKMNEQSSVVPIF